MDKKGAEVALEMLGWCGFCHVLSWGALGELRESTRSDYRPCDGNGIDLERIIQW